MCIRDSIKGSHGVVVAVFCSKKGSSGAKCVLKNGGASGATEFTIFGETEGNYQDINRRFESGIFADVTGSAEWTVVFK